MGGVGQLAGRLGRAMPWWSTGRSEPPPADSGMPVLLVHGLADGASVVPPLRRGLRGCGVGPFIPFGYSALDPDIRTAARVLGEQVELECARSGARTVVLIGYSLGGLIARYYVQRLGGDAYVSLVITLATPHGGAAAALLAPPHPLQFGITCDYKLRKPGQPDHRKLPAPLPAPATGESTVP